MADTPQPQPLLDDEQIDMLYDFLDSERVSDETLDLFGAHGFQVAQAIALNPADRVTRLAAIFDTPPNFDDSEQRHTIETALEALRERALAVFESGDVPDLPFDLDMNEEDKEQEHPVRLWCAGFMESVLLDEAGWFGEQEAAAAEMLLPFMILSGLFDEEDDELATIGRNPREATRLAEQLPELTLDLYLLYRAPIEQEKPAGKPGRGGAGKKTRSKHGVRH